MSELPSLESPSLPSIPDINLPTIELPTLPQSQNLNLPSIKLPSLQSSQSISLPTIVLPTLTQISNLPRVVQGFSSNIKLPPGLPKNFSLTLNSIKNTPLENEDIVDIVSEICRQETVTEYADIIRELVAKYNMDLEMRTFETEILSLRPKFNVLGLRKYYEVVRESFETIILDAIRGYQSDPQATVYIERLEDAFSHVYEEDFVRDILDYIEKLGEEDGIVELTKHYKIQLGKISSYAPLPTYINNFNVDRNNLPQLEESDFENLSDYRSLATSILSGLDEINVVVDNQNDEKSAIDLLTNKITQTESSDREESIRNLTLQKIENLQEDPNIFRIYGPSNPYPDTDYSQIRIKNQPDDYTTDLETFKFDGDYDPNIVFGGARMFTDMYIEFNDDDELPIDNWFTGVCQQCNSRIKKYHHAVRLPRHGGGWIGCYCSWPCVRENVEETFGNDPDFSTVYKFQIELTNQIEKSLNEIGIQERDYELLEINNGQGDQDDENYELDQDAVDQLKSVIPKPKSIFDQHPLTYSPRPGTTELL